jgi:hypothetical protein
MQLTMRLWLHCALVPGALLLSNLQRVSAVPIQFQSEATQTPLLELYTSEGCSSCPPAEEWLSGLKTSPKLWKDFVPVAFHVDYWDYLGWKDPFATQAFTERQHRYAEQWRSRSVYTPGFVLDGKEWRDWGKRGTLPLASGKRAGTIAAHSEDGKKWSLRFQPSGSDASSSYDFHVAILGFDLVTDVKAGENRGRKLQHDFVVLALNNASSSKDGGSFQAVVSVDSKLAVPSKRLAVAVWVTTAKNPQPIQSVGGWLVEK